MHVEYALKIDRVTRGALPVLSNPDRDLDNNLELSSDHDSTKSTDRRSLFKARLIKNHELTPEDAEIVSLRLFDGLQFWDIAADLGLPRNTVSMRFYRLFKKIRRSLNENT